MKSYKMLMMCVSAGCLMASCSSHKSTLAEPSRSIVILYENDVHCNIDGYAHLAGLRDAVADTSWTQLVSSGDFIQGGSMGALSKGRYIIDIMKGMNYDAVTLGNHEFDYGTPHLKSLLNDLGAPVTCSNFVELASGKTVYPAYVMRMAGGKKIAYVGVLVPTTVSSEAIGFYDEAGRMVYDLVPDEISQRVQRSVDEARAEGADYVIALSHLGWWDSEWMNSIKLAQETSGIDVILDGHTHTVLPMAEVTNKDGNKVIVTQTGTQFANVGKLLIRPDGKISTSLIPLSEIAQVNERVQFLTDSVRTEGDMTLKRTVCRSEVNLRIRDELGRVIVRMGETNAGNLVADAFRVMADAEIGVLNAGSIRNEVGAGELTYGDMVSLLPYDNWLCLAEATGAQILEMLEANVVSLPGPDGQFPQASGLKYTVDAQSHEVSNVMVLDKNTGEYLPLDPERTYTLSVTDYVIYNGGLRNTLKDVHVLRKSFIQYCDALVEYVKASLGGNIGQEYAAPQGRITITGM